MKQEQKSKIAEGLRAVRIQLGWTQKELADRSGVDRATISLIENGHEDPRARTVTRLAEAMGMNPAELWRNESGFTDQFTPQDSESISGELEYEPIVAEHLHSGLEELLFDEHTRLLINITAEEETMLRSIRTRREAPLTKDFFVDVLIAYRRHKSSNPARQKSEGES